MVRYPGLAAAALVAVALTVTGCAKGSYTAGAGGAYGNPVSSSPAATSSAGTQAVSLKTEPTRAGRVLASGSGLTLYYYAEDKRGSGKSVCTGACASAWPPLVAPVRAPAGVRLPGKLGVITRPGGVRQVTLNGYPLYYFAGDKAPGQAKGNGIKGAWHVIKVR